MGRGAALHHPVFVLTHYAREPLELTGTTFYFVTEGIEAALEQATEAGSKGTGLQNRRPLGDPGDDGIDGENGDTETIGADGAGEGVGRRARRLVDERIGTPRTAAS